MESTAQPTPDRILDTKDVAAMLDLHEKTVERMFREKKLPGMKFGRSWRCSEQAIYKMLQPS